jgi:hypothetical protein
MAVVSVRLGGIGPHWTAACKHAVADLDRLFRRRGIGVALALHGAGPVISVVTDPGILGTLVHGRTSAETDGSGRLLRAEVRLPVKLTINTPSGVREAGIGMAEVVAAHELVHALGHEPRRPAQGDGRPAGGRQAAGRRRRHAAAPALRSIGRNPQGGLGLNGAEASRRLQAPTNAGRMTMTSHRIMA